MLTKDLLKHSIRKNRVSPYFLDPENAGLQEIAQQLITYFSAPEIRRGDLNEQLDNYIRGCPRQFEAKGLRKLLLDRSEFTHTEEIDYVARRAALLARASHLHKDNSYETPELFRQLVLGDDTSGPGLYADLPDNEVLCRFKPIYPKQLIHRYNVAQVQGLLFSAESITMETADPKAANLRRTFKFLKFFRLLSRTFRQEDKSLRVEIDGPLSILNSTRKYGLQLASFFPAVCLLDNWKLTAKVTAKKRECALELDHDSGFESHYRHLSAYVPEEVSMFASQFKKNAKGWTINPNTPFIRLNDGEVVFPDFTFENENKDQVYLELFHRWHRGNLLPRLRYCIAQDERPLILGIDKSLMTGELKELLDAGLLESHRFFTFRDYPSVRNVQRCLDGFSQGDLFG